MRQSFGFYKKGCPLGLISVHKWCKCVESITNLNIPWRALADRLVKMTDDGKDVFYKQFPAVKLGKDDNPSSARDRVKIYDEQNR